MEKNSSPFRLKFPPARPGGGLIRGLGGLRGFSLVETLMSLAILALITAVVTNLVIEANRGGISVNNSLKAQHIAAESFEAIRSIRDQNFLNLSNGIHGLQLSAGLWTLTGSADLVDGVFTRGITISDVYRNGNGDVDLNGTQLDKRAKRVSVLVAWQSTTQGNTSVTSEEIITDWTAFERINSSSSEWGNGTRYQTAVSSSGDGALILDSYTDSWQSSFNDAHYIFTNNANANEIVVVGSTGYMIGNRNGQIPQFSVLNVANPSNVTTLGTLLMSLANAYDLAVKDNYAYVGTDDNQNGELMTVNITTASSPTLANQYNISGNRTIRSVAIEGDRLYVGLSKNTNEEFLIFNIQNPAQPAILNSYEIDADVYDIAVNSNIVYLALNGGSSSLRILDVSNPSNITLKSDLSVTPEKNGRALSYLSNKVYFASSTSTSQEFKIIDVTTPTAPSIVSGLEMGNDLRGIDIFAQYVFVTAANVDQEFKVINIQNINSPTLAGTLPLGGNGDGIFVNANAIFITSADNSSALDILTYPVTHIYSDGTFTSNAFDSGSATTKWLTLHWDGILPTNTTVKIQARFADTQAHLSTATWSGPNGTNSTYYTDFDNIITVPSGASGTRWMQFIVNLAGDGQTTPEVYSVRIQYAI